MMEESRKGGRNFVKTLWDRIQKVRKRCRASCVRQNLHLEGEQSWGRRAGRQWGLVTEAV